MVKERKHISSYRMKPVLFILGCEKYRVSLVNAIRRFAHPSWEVIGSIGNPTLSEPHFDASAQILYLPVSDIYEALPAKVHAAFQWIVTNRPGVPGIFKTDEDILVDTNELASAVHAHSAKHYWGLHPSKTVAKTVDMKQILGRFQDKSLRPPHQTAQYCWGAGYWVSAEALQHICAARDIYAASYLEDICTGYVLNQHGIFPSAVPPIKYTEMNR